MSVPGSKMKVIADKPGTDSDRMVLSQATPFKRSASVDAIPPSNSQLLGQDTRKKLLHETSGLVSFRFVRGQTILYVGARQFSEPVNPWR